jgi:hypothetical protein
MDCLDERLDAAVRAARSKRGDYEEMTAGGDQRGVTFDQKLVGSPVVARPVVGLQVWVGVAEVLDGDRAENRLSRPHTSCSTARASVDLVAVVESHGLIGTPDEELLAHAAGQERVLVTPNVADLAAHRYRLARGPSRAPSASST